MGVMIFKMSMLTALYVLLTVALWNWLRDKPMSAARKLALGLVYGLCSILSTHFGVDYGNMMLNVRDMGPLAAGLFFDPTCGIIAGVIGGVERYIAGEYWGVGEYTRIACGVSTFLAGFVAAFMNRVIFNRKKPSVTYAFFMGAVMEVFHMYAVLLTHRNDMNKAFSVVQICSVPMILFTGLGLAICSALLKWAAGELKNPFRRRPEDVPVSQRFQVRLFVVTMGILLVTFLFSYVNQTLTAEQNARDTLDDTAGDILATYARIREVQQGIETTSDMIAVVDANAIATSVAWEGGVEALEDGYLESQMALYGLDSVCVLSPEGKLQRSAGEDRVYRVLLQDLQESAEGIVSKRLSGRRIVTDVRIEGGVVQTVLDDDYILGMLNQSGLEDAMSYFHVGAEGTFDIISPTGFSLAGNHKSLIVKEWGRLASREEAFFTETLYGVKSLCRVEHLEDGGMLLLTLPTEELYLHRDTQAYETALSGILLFTAIYVLISMLVQQIVVDNLVLVNDSLTRITGGDLDEVVNVRNSSEFASLSDDINQTVSVLKGYIAAAEKRIEQELEFARNIQDAALPKNFRYPRTDFELFATMDPAKEVGGDFYDFFFVDNDHMALVIADVSGKGIPASLFMMRAKTTLRGQAESGRSPSQILFRANNILCDGNDAEMFVTAWIGILDLNSGLMRCANAGHEYPALMRAGEDYALLRDKHGLALAAMPDMPFKEYELQLGPGDGLFVYTDGVPEAIDEQTNQYGTDRMIQKLNTLKHLPLRETLPAMRQDIQDFAGSAEQFDDITMLGFVYYGSGAKEAQNEGD